MTKEEIMFHLASLLALCIVTTPAESERPAPESLFRGDIHHGWYLGPVVRLTDVKDHFASLVGFRGGWTVDRTLSVGLAGYGMATQNVEMEPALIGGNPEETYYLQMGYGGAEIGFIQNSNRIMHLAAHLLIGGGGVCYTDDWHDDCDDDDNVLDSDAFFLVEPSIDVELNIAKPFRVGLGASYRFITDVELPALENADLDGFACSVTFKFGRL